LPSSSELGLILRESDTGRVRVVAGTARGRRLVAPSGRDTRPSSDRVRESIFNALHSLGAIEDATVVDLYAGSGALGIEALSRGAAHCTFVESAPAAVAAIHQNLDGAGLAERATVDARTVEAYLAREPEPVDLALCDPPYAFAGWAELLARLPAGLVVCESDRPVELGPGWDAARTRRYGGTVVTFGRPAGAHET
jgi:16S rRNA (guanine966-N2)-methyltransferase